MLTWAGRVKNQFILKNIYQVDLYEKNEVALKIVSLKSQIIKYFLKPIYLFFS